MWKMDPMWGFNIRLLFTLPPRDSTLQYKRCVHLWNNFPCIITLDPTIKKTTISSKSLLIYQSLTEIFVNRHYTSTDPGLITFTIPSTVFLAVYRLQTQDTKKLLSQTIEERRTRVHHVYRSVYSAFFFTIRSKTVILKVKDWKYAYER